MESRVFSNIHNIIYFIDIISLIKFCQTKIVKLNVLYIQLFEYLYLFIWMYKASYTYALYIIIYDFIYYYIMKYALYHSFISFILFHLALIIENIQFFISFT
jgi:hypothetical protein